ncbi:MAG: sensor histidine kinase [Acidimicrobiia bacterium]
MRRRLSVLVLAVTALVVVAYTVPLGILVRTQADERARSDAERVVQALAGNIVTLVSRTGEIDMTLIATLQIPDGISILGNDGTNFGIESFDRAFAQGTAEALSSASTYLVDDSWQVSLPVIGRNGWAVVTAVVPAEELTRGVYRAWGFLLLLGVVLIATAMLLADRLGRTLRDPVDELAAAARRIGDGQLDTRVEPPGIPELTVVADALNRLAPQLRNLLVSEREALADLSHRLRTPLAGMRLQTEAMSDPTERVEMLGLVDRMQSAVDRLIIDARAVDAEARADLAAVAAHHAQFWSVLADEEQRTFQTSLPPVPVPVDVSAEELGDVLDILIGNVFDHTARAVGFQLSVAVEEGRAILMVADDGGGFPTDIDPLARGESTAGSTGLGLDIARRLAERLGGGISLDSGPAGGARTTLELPLSKR